MNMARRSALPLGFAVVVAGATWTARARAEGVRTIVTCAEGPDAAEVVSRVAARLRPPYRKEDSADFCRAVTAGRASALASAAKDRSAGAKLMVRTRAAAHVAHAEAAVLVQTRRSKGTTVHVWLVDASGDGAAEVDQEVTLGPGASVDEQGDAAWKVLAADLGGSNGEGGAAASPAPPDAKSVTAPEPSDGAPGTTPASAAPAAAGADEGAASNGSPQDGGRGDAILSIRAGVESGSRDFTYVDRLTSTLRSYTLFAAPIAVADAELYPLARTRAAVLKDLGVTFDYAVALGLSSSDSSGSSVSTAWSSFDVGARERIHAGRSWLLGLHGGYGQMSYSFSGALDAPAALPGVEYRFVRGGADARVALGPFSVYGSGSYLYVLSTGPIGTYFSRESVGGVEGRVGLARALGYGFEVSLEVAYTRFFYTLNPQPGDAYVAGGALDQMAFGSLGVAYVL